MTDFTIQPDKLNIKPGKDTLGVYQFNSNIAKHYFCKTCGIYPFHESLKNPGHYRVNLGCINEIDTNTIVVDIFDGKNI